MMDKESQEEVVKRAAASLHEHFDNVRIFVSSVVPGDDISRFYSFGLGNWFAQYGQVQDWIVSSNEQTRIGQRSQET